MTPTSARLDAVIAAIDEANARDPNRLEIDGRSEPAELGYGRRMSETLARLAPAASEHLRIAVRGQHIERWTSPRQNFPEGRAGYLQWRNGLKDYHARRVGELMAVSGYGADDIARVRALVRKERLKSDAEAQTLEDAACLVFLEHYLTGLMSKMREEQFADVLAKTWNKMSALGHEHARAIDLPPRARTLLQQGLAKLQR